MKPMKTIHLAEILLIHAFINSWFVIHSWNIFSRARERNFWLQRELWTKSWIKRDPWKKLVLREIISGCLCTSLSSVHGQTNADKLQQKNSSNFLMATFSYVCQLSLISIRKKIKSIVCHRHIPTKGDVMCYLFNDLETHTQAAINYVTSPKA